MNTTFSGQVCSKSKALSPWSLDRVLAERREREAWHPEKL